MRSQISPTVQPSSAGQGVPEHVAIIMDGNGRWAVQQGRPRLMGHRAGTQRVRQVVRALADYGVRYITLFAFSTENWGRPRREVRSLMNLLGEMIREETLALHAEGVRVWHIGRLDRLSTKLQQAISDVLEMTKDNTGLTLCVAFDYGGRDEILGAIRDLLRDGVAPDQVNENMFHRYLYTADIPDPDLIIRTGGELRLSNFMLWQSAYSEYYCTTALWPDFDQAEVKLALQAYGQRSRRFGKVPSKV